MKFKLRVLHTVRRWFQVTLPAAVLGFQLAVPAAHADSNNIYVNDSVTFTVQDVALSKGTDSAYLQFGLKLQNSSQTVIDMNDYGVKVSDKNGYSFSAQLTSKQYATIAGGQTVTFRYSSNIPAGDTLDQLQVVVFRWDMTKPDLMDELGEAPLADAGTSSAVRETIVQADEADSSLPTDAAVRFQAVRTFVVHKDEQAYLYTDLLATNNGSTSFSLPAALKYRYTGTQSDSYSAAVVTGTDAALLPGEARKVTLKAAIPSGQPQAAAGYSLQFYSETASGVSVLGSLDVAGVTTESVIGEAQPVFSRNGTKQLTVTATNVTTSEQSDGLHVSATVVAQNQGTDIAVLPALSASFQFGSDGAAVSSTDASAHPAYLSVNESEAYHFEAVLPSGLAAKDVRLVVFAQTLASSTTTSTAAASGSTSASGSATSSESTTTSGSTTLSGSTTSLGSTTSSGNTNSSTSASTGSSSSSSSSTAAVSSGGAAPIAVSVLAGATDGSNLLASAKEYKIGDILSLDKGIISSDLDVSLVEFHVNPDDNDGFRNAFAKFVLTNNSKSAVTFPTFSTGLIADNGASYDGSRQTSVSAKIMPGTSYPVSFVYLIPSSLNSDHLALKVSDSNSGALAANVAVSPQSAADGNELKTYPYKVTLNNTALQWTYSNGTFTYTMKLDLKLERETQVIVDANFASLEFDLVDGLDRTLATQTIPFTGMGKLVNGLQTISFGGFTSITEPLTVRVYETFTTADGTVKRLLKKINNP